MVLILAFLHALPDEPMHKRPLGVHEVELVVEALPGGADGRGVGQAADSALYLGQVSPGHHRGGLVVDAHLQGGTN